MESNDSIPFSNDIANCQTCLDLRADYLCRMVRRFPGYTTNAPHSCSTKKLAQSADDGCFGCSLLNTAVEEIKKKFDFSFTTAEIEYLSDEKLQGLSLKLWLIQGPNIDAECDERTRARATWGLNLELRRGSGLDDANAEIRISSPNYEIFIHENAMEALLPYSAVRSKPHRSESTGSDAAAEWTLKQLQRCESNHPSCWPSNKESKRSNLVELPTRVIDIGDDTVDSSASSLCLRETRGGHGNYACLSHCWGLKDSDSVNQRPLETTEGNLASFLERIPYEMLPKSFQEAVIFTRKLGIRYLWIDSLCIVQNSPKDWAYEAGKMATVFQNATITLAAASSSNSQGGLFRERKTTMGISDGLIQDTKIFIREFPDVNFFDYQMVGGSIGRSVSPLMKRAWVFQERLLSRRFLVFSPLELVWECKCAAESESGHPWIARSVREKLLVGENDGSLKLSYPSDVLPAMAGLAKRLSSFFNCDYVAGLWRDSFLSGLLWIRNQTMLYQEKTRAKDHRRPGVPSWSWASPGTPISSVPALKDAFVDGNDAHAVLSGYLIPMVVGEHGCAVIQGMMGGGMHGFQRYQDFNWSTPGTCQIVHGDRLYGLPIAAMRRDVSLEYDLEIVFLILRSKQSQVDTECQHNGVFERVGIGHLSLLTLKPYQYILEGEDGRYKNRGGSQFALNHRNQVSSSFRNEGIEYDYNMDMYGLPHLELIHRQLEQEVARLKDWQRRRDDQEHQAHERTIITIV
ncbi:het-domain-containing [Trichoderma arundinaceum]|uniref:Het-domain-containing n=1 Tax=Trichoderma arundinaceum TaxID=490622 RepID=A0A395NX62_TRIAR|nr:het-domain-containing [Trichoderma arundinaceum]